MLELLFPLSDGWIGALVGEVEDKGCIPGCQPQPLNGNKIKMYLLFKIQRTAHIYLCLL